MGGAEPKPVSGAVKLAAGLLVALLCAGMLGAAELLVRWRESKKYGFGNVDRFGAVIDGVRRLEANLDTPRLHTNALGLRGPQLEQPKPAGRLRLAFLGGSTTFCMEASSDAATWPALVRDRVAAALPDRTVDYVNAGVPGAALPEMHALWRAVVRQTQPDLVVLYEATNDLASDTRKLALERGLIDGNPSELSWLGQRSLLVGLVEKNLKLSARQGGGGKALDFDAAALSAGFKARYAALVDEIASSGARVVLVTFAARVRPGLAPDALEAAMLSSRYYAPYLSAEGAIAGFAAYNARIRELAREKDVLLVEGEDDIPADAAHYTDSVHLTDLGMVRQAERVSKALVEALRAPAPAAP